MEYTKKTVEELIFTGYVRELSTKEDAYIMEAVDFWNEFYKSDNYQLLVDQAHRQAVMKIGYAFDKKNETVKYMIGIPGKFDIPGTEVISFESQTFLEFIISGDLDIEIPSKVLYLHKLWLPRVKYELSNGPLLEYFPNSYNNRDSICRFLMPIKTD